jgi:hypothetical protein
MYAKQSLADLAGESPACENTREGRSSKPCGGISDFAVGVKASKYAGRNAKA